MSHKQILDGHNIKVSKDYPGFTLRRLASKSPVEGMLIHLDIHGKINEDEFIGALLESEFGKSTTMFSSITVNCLTLKEGAVVPLGVVDILKQSGVLIGSVVVDGIDIALEHNLPLLIMSLKKATEVVLIKYNDTASDDRIKELNKIVGTSKYIQVTSPGLLHVSSSYELNKLFSRVDLERAGVNLNRFNHKISIAGFSFEPSFYNIGDPKLPRNLLSEIKFPDFNRSTVQGKALHSTDINYENTTKDTVFLSLNVIAKAFYRADLCSQLYKDFCNEMSSIPNISGKTYNDTTTPQLTSVVNGNNVTYVKTVNYYGDPCVVLVRYGDKEEDRKESEQGARKKKLEKVEDLTPSSLF